MQTSWSAPVYIMFYLSELKNFKWRPFNPFKPEFTIVIHYELRIAVAIPDF